MKRSIATVWVLLLIICCDKNAMAFDKIDGMANSPVINTSQSVFMEMPRTHFQKPIPDTVDASDITTIFITKDDRLFWREDGGPFNSFPTFNKVNYLAHFFYNTLVENPNE